MFDAVIFVAVKEPVRTMFPVFCAFVVIADSIVSPALPDFLINTLPSGTFMANCPTPRELVVGTEPGVRLLKCMILSAIVYKYLVRHFIAYIFF